MKTTKLSDKAIYRSIKFLHVYMKCDVVHETYKLLWFDMIEAKTQAEKEVKNYIDAFKYLQNNKCEGITKKSLKRAYYLLTEHQLSDKKVEKLLEDYYKQREESAHINASIMHQTVYKLRPKKKLPFAHLLVNFILYKQGYTLFTLYPSEVEKYQTAIKDLTKDWTIMYGVIVANELHNRKNEVQIRDNQLVISKEKIIATIIEHKEELKDKYSIDSFYLYGSLLKGYEHQSSDIDLLIVIKQDLAIYEKYSIVTECKKYLENLFKSKVDLIDISQAIKIFGTNGIQKSIKIF
jgi:predicted nucleotidyltransferase